MLADAVAALETPRASAIPTTPSKSFGIICGPEILRFGYLKFYPHCVTSLSTGGKFQDPDDAAASAYFGQYALMLTPTK